MSRGIVVHCEGGWASQLNSLAFALSLDTERFILEHHTGGGFQRRDFVLGQLVQPRQIVILDDWQPVPTNLVVRASRALQRRIAAKRATLWPSENLEMQKPPADGTFHIAQIPEIARRISVAGLPNFAEPGEDRAISVHLRLGDYYLNPSTRKYHGVVDPASIKHAVDMISEQVGPLQVRVFSEDPHTAATLLIQAGLPAGRINIEYCQPNNIWEDTFQMTRTLHFVGTNSRVSMWAALSLANSRDQARRVFMPNRWFTPRGLLMGAAGHVGAIGVPSSLLHERIEQFPTAFSVE